MKSIPINAARDIAKRYDYDQVVIIARKVGEGGGEHVTTYGRNRANCNVAARIGNFIKYKIMEWPVKTNVADCEATEVLAETEQLLPYTWRSMPDYDAVLEDIAKALAERDRRIAELVKRGSLIEDDKALTQEPALRTVP